MRCKRCKFDAWVEMIPWRRKWQPTPVFLPGNFYRQRTLAGYSLWGCKRVRHNWAQAQTEFQEAVVSLEMVACWGPSKVHFSCSVVSDFLQPHGLQHTMLPCLSPTPGIYWNSCPLSRWCHPTISSSVVPFPSCLQSFPASESFPRVSSSHQVV